MDTFREVTVRILPFGIISVVAFFAVGYQLGTINLNWHIIPILILYPIWGIVQQFLVIGLVAGNLQDLKGNRPGEFVIITLTALLFGLVHYPSYWLMLGTFVLALLYGFIYLRARNVYVMGLFHGWLGGLFFYTVVGRDPFAEVFGKLLQ
jgi:membrane protease YdiL (CAAX protease family)